MLSQVLANPLRALVLRATLRVWPHHSIRGFLVTDLSSAGSGLPEVLSKLESALALYALHDARGFDRFCRNVRRFVLVDVPGPEYVHCVRACMLRAAYVEEASPEQVAMTVVHEGTHARLWSAGFDYAPTRRQRIESICVRAETAFAMKLPVGEQLAEQARGKLREDWWSEENEYRRRLGQLKELGRPGWYLRFYEYLNDPY